MPDAKTMRRAIQEYMAQNRNRWVRLQGELLPAMRDVFDEPDMPRESAVERAAEMAGGRCSYTGPVLPGWFYRVDKEGRRLSSIMVISTPELALLGGQAPKERPYKRSTLRKANPVDRLYNRVIRTPELRMAFLGAQDGCCAGCGRRYDHWRCLEVDHVIALDAANDVPANLQLLCPPCNNWKGNNLTTEQLWQKNSTEGFMLEQAAAERAHAAAWAYGKQLMETL